VFPPRAFFMNCAVSSYGRYQPQTWTGLTRHPYDVCTRLCTT
jgi:hypothetical protein